MIRGHLTLHPIPTTLTDVTLACAVEHLDRDVAAAFRAAADRQFAAEEANPRLPLERGG
jgi:hypothetical protein